jgi:hypothetical protein
LGQVNPDLVTTPYTREVFGGSLEEPEIFGEGNYLDEMLRRATRFLPEVDFVQYAQSYNGKTSIPIYDIFSSGPVNSFDPLSKQLGMQTSRKPNELQKEISRMGLKTYELYNKNTVENPAVDLYVQEMLSKSLPQKFFAWKEQVRHTDRFAGQTYDEIEDNGAKRFLLEEFIKNEIAAAKKYASDGFENLLQERPKIAAGYIRNMYVVSEKLAISDTGDKGIYDTAVSTFTQGNFANAADYLGDSDSILEELLRRQEIMSWAEKMGKGFVGFPKERIE